MDRRTFLGALASGLLAAPLAAGAQPAGKVYRVGIVAASRRRGSGRATQPLDPLLDGRVGHE
jgi:hypothetical protein